MAFQSIASKIFLVNITSFHRQCNYFYTILQILNCENATSWSSGDKAVQFRNCSCSMIILGLQINSVPSAIGLPSQFFLVDASDEKLLAESKCASSFSVWVEFSSRSCSSSSSSNFFGWRGLSRSERPKSPLQNLWNYFLHVLCINASSKIEQINSVISAAFFSIRMQKVWNVVNAPCRMPLVSLMIFEVKSARLLPIKVCFET